MLAIDSKNLKPPYLIHSDSFRTFGFIKESFKASKVRVNPSVLHFNLLCQVFGKHNIILPSFNYEFPKTKCYDTKRTVSQVGSLTNFVLESDLLGRTKTPIFSFLTDIPELLKEHNYPFSSGSTFDFVHKHDGTIIFYGADISSCTYLHFIENEYGPPVFRYDKRFTGTITDNHLTRDIFVEFHARPLGLQLDYNWKLLFQLLIDEDVIFTISPNCFAVKARQLSRVWGDFFIKSQFDILSDETKEIVRNKFNVIGRRFAQKDFEVIS
jgi:Aminoglycoside 3-N-acetyltransferase